MGIRLARMSFFLPLLMMREQRREASLHDFFLAQCFILVMTDTLCYERSFASLPQVAFITGLSPTNKRDL